MDGIDVDDDNAVIVDINGGGVSVIYTTTITDVEECRIHILIQKVKKE